MKKVIATVKIDNVKKEAFDVEINSDTTASKILTMLCEAYYLGSEKNYNIFVANLGRLLQPNETLEEAGVWDGAIMILRKVR
jgi:uncharacterized ubiquitin-like protein YukD